MEFFYSISKFRAAFRQIGEILPSRQKVLIPPDLSLGLCDFGIGLAQALFQGFGFGQKRHSAGIRYLKLQHTVSCHTLLGLQRLKAG